MIDPRPLVWWIVIALALAGVITHWLKQVVLMRSSGTPGMNPIGFKQYWIGYWPQSLIALFSTAGGVAFFHEANMLTHATAFFIGYLGNSLADTIGGRVQAMINAPPPGK